MQQSGTYIKQKRKYRGLSLKQFAEKTTVKQEVLSDIEQNKKMPTKKQINLVVKFLKIDINELLINYYVNKWFKQIENKPFAAKIIYELQKPLEEKNTFPERC